MSAIGGKADMPFSLQKPGAVSTTCSRTSAAAAGSPFLRKSSAQGSTSRSPDETTNPARPCCSFLGPDMAYLNAMRPEELLAPTPSGVCCKPGTFFIDPTRPVDKAVITHGHSDHARPGHGAVLATQETLDMMRLRYGENFAGTTQAVRYGETLKLGGATVTFHPAGHVLGSAQVKVECKGMRIVASGDYKDKSDPTCAPFELQPCDVFITEATFGLPVFRHGDADAEIKKLLHSVKLFPERAHLVGAYSLGKAQRVIALLRRQGYDKPIYLHGAMEKITRYYESRGVDSWPTRTCQRREESRACRHHHALPAVRDERPVGAALSRSGHLLCFRLDAGARTGAPGRCRAAARHFRPRRLGRPDRHHRCDRRLRNLGDSWPGGCPGALERDARPKARPLAIVGYGDEDETDGVSDSATGEPA